MKRMVSIDEQESPQGQKRRIMGNGGGVIMRKTARRNKEKRNYRCVEGKTSPT